MKKEKGITLVALVVTIVVLLILAGITITYVMGDNSIFNQASKSKLHTEIAKIEEIAQTLYSSKLLENAKNGLETRVETSQIIKELRDEGYTIEQKAVSVDITLEPTSMTIKTDDTAELKIIYGEVEEPFIYYVEVQGKYYRMYNDKGMITIDREASNITKTEFEEDKVALTATSSKNNIATAKVKENSNSIIEILSTATEGETIITVTYGSSTKICTVKTVKPILANSIELNKTDYIVTGGESWKHDLQLVATVKPNNVTEKGITWTSDDPEIATVDENGLVKAGTKGGETTITATTKDKSNKSATCKVTTELFGKTNSEKTPYTDSDGNTVQIPDGYAVGTSDNVNKVTGGLVVQDNDGNQFIWIPVGNVKKNGTIAFSVTLGRYDFVTDQAIPTKPVASADTQIENKIYNKYYHEELTNTNGSSYKNAKAKDLQKFIDNTKLDGGYWLGRYEACNSSGTKSKYDETPWTINQPTSSKEAQKLKTSGTYQSDLVNSYAWDTAIVFIEKSGHVGYSSQKSVESKKLNTGRSGDKVCNIYDMASNCYEWSTETCMPSNSGFPCTGRGGTYEATDNYSSSFRIYREETYINSFTSFRIILYRI